MKNPPVQVLLVEDNPGDARLLREMLDQMGTFKTELTHRSSMKDALSHLATNVASVVLLDLGLPDAQGIGAIRRVREVAPRTPLVVLTAIDDETTATKALQEGAQDYLIKGRIETQALLRAIRYAIERQRMQVEVEQVRRLQLQMRDEFISTVSHELRTPLTSIRGALGLLEGGVLGKLPEQAEAMVAIALHNSERLVRIINDILDVERIKSGRLEMHIANVPLGALLQGALTVNHSFGEKYQVRFILEPVAARIEVMADPDRLLQVMANLLSNAAKFSPVGSEVHVRVIEAGARVRVEVEDHGVGIPEGFRRRVFEKFAQADSSTSRHFEGTGLGLSITRQLLEAMSGSVDFKTITGEGTTFYFELPRAGELLAPQEIDAGDTARCRVLIFGDESTLTSEYTGAPRILHVEDDQDLAQVLSVALAGNVEVTLASTLDAAEAHLRDSKFSLLLLDMALPDGSGLELLGRMSSIATHPIPVVILSATDVPAAVQQRVAATFVKSKASEAHIVETILSLVQRSPGRG